MPRIPKEALPYRIPPRFNGCTTGCCRSVGRQPLTSRWGPAARPSPGEGRRAAGSAPPRHRELGRVLFAVTERTPGRPGDGPRPARDGAERPDRPAKDRYRETAVTWLDGLLDALKLGSTALVGHSGGGLWALWYALAHPDRVTRLVLIAPPALPGTRCPLPIRLLSTPVVGQLLSRLLPPTPKSVLQFAHHAARERETLGRYPHLVDLMVAIHRDPIADRVTTEELRVFVSPFALLSTSGFRGRSRVQRDELRHLSVPTLVIWGENERLAALPLPAQRPN